MTKEAKKLEGEIPLSVIAKGLSWDMEKLLGNIEKLKKLNPGSVEAEPTPGYTLRVAISLNEPLNLNDNAGGADDNE